MPRPLCWLALPLLPLLLAGCGSGEDLVPVSGRITLGGQPLPDVHVSFQPRARAPGAASAGPGSYGQTDSDGRYTLRSVATDASGAVPGKHEVRLASPLPETPEEGDIPATAKDPIPPEFRNGSTAFTVPPGGTDQADFELQAAR